MRAVVVGVVLAGLLGGTRAVRADVYEYRAASGVRVFTNVPVTVEAHRAELRPITIVPAPILTFGIVSAPMVGERTPYDAIIRDVSTTYGVEYALVKAMIKAESRFDSRAISASGARGLMQLMPSTAADYRVRDAFVPRDNIEGGVRHLRMLLDRYDGNIPLAVAAYNAGQARVEAARGVPAIGETQAYLARVLRYRAGYLRETMRGGVRR